LQADDDLPGQRLGPTGFHDLFIGETPIEKAYRRASSSAKGLLSLLRPGVAVLLFQ
jgi:hypothetical protein